MLRRDPVVLAWVAGLGLATLVYVVGPGQFLFRLMDLLHVAAWRISEMVADLSVMALDVVRALAIGLYATFVVLAVALARRGGRARGALVVVSVLFVVLVDRGSALTDARWTAALVLSTVASLVMTTRCRQTALVPRF